VMHSPMLQTALAPAHRRVQPLPQLSMSQRLPSLQVGIEQPPRVHACRRQIAPSPVQSSWHDPPQSRMVHVAP
jgi:hypothetical protein